MTSSAQERYDRDFISRYGLEVLRAAIAREQFDHDLNQEQMIEVMMQGLVWASRYLRGNISTTKLLDRVDRDLAELTDDLAEDLRSLTEEEREQGRYWARIHLNLVPGRPPTPKELKKQERTGSFYDSKRLGG